MNSEREMLAAFLPPVPGSAADQWEQSLLRKGPDCPLEMDLMLLARGHAADALARRLDLHVRECAACTAAVERYRLLLSREEQDPGGAAASIFDDANEAAPAKAVEPARSAAQTAPAEPTPAGLPHVSEPTPHGRLKQLAALFRGGAEPGALLASTGLSPSQAWNALFEARDQGLLGVKPPTDPLVLHAGPRTLPFPRPQNLLDLLRTRGQTLRQVIVRQSGSGGAGLKESWDERIPFFGADLAPCLLSLLSKAHCAGVAWGRTVAAAIAGLERICQAPPRRAKPLISVATAGGLVGECKISAESSSSILASRLADAINGSWDQLFTLHGVEAFISYIDHPEETEFIRRRIARFPNYQAIFGGPAGPGHIHALDAVVTSCGNAHQFNQFWTTELKNLGLTPEQLNDITVGNIGGVLLEREDLDARDRALFHNVARRWTGITRAHYTQCAQREPGVILLALGYNKADVVLKCVELNLVSELIIDEDLARALWDKVDPQHHHPRTLEAVLCRPA